MKYAFTIAAVAGLAAASAHAGHERFHRRANDMVTVTDWTVVTVTDVVTVVGPSPTAKESSVVAPSSAASAVSVPPVQSAPAPVSSSPSAAPVVPTTAPVVATPSAPAQQHTTLQTLTSEIPKPAVPATTSSAAAAAPTSPATGGSGNGNFGLMAGATTPANCPKDKPCQGDMTYYNPSAGMGSCGYTDTDDDDVVAIIASMWGSRSSLAVNQPDNPLCDKMIKITNPKTGETAVGKVRDKCPGCSGNAGIDLSPSLMKKVNGGVADGRLPVEWYFL